MLQGGSKIGIWHLGIAQKKEGGVKPQARLGFRRGPIPTGTKGVGLGPSEQKATLLTLHLEATSRLMGCAETLAEEKKKGMVGTLK